MNISLFSPLNVSADGQIGQFLQLFTFSPLAILDLAVVGIVLFGLFRILRETRALGIIYGILVLVIVYILARVLRLELLSLITANFLTLLFVAIPVLFQPELRRLLERLGRTRLGTLKPVRRNEYRETVTTVAEAARILSNTQTGALVVFKRATGLTDMSTAGTTLDANVSTPLLLNLFYDKSPLHDGAVIIDRDRITSAGVMLPLSEREYGYTLGARHRAAVGLTEQCDAVVLVVSEEKGTISLVVGGKITPGIKADVLSQILAEFLSRTPQAAIAKVRDKATDATRKRQESK